MLKIIRNFFNGLAFGMVQTVPSISGGTIAIILGFYFELIRAINHFGENVRNNLRFLVPLFLGTACGIILFSSLVNFLLESHSFPTMLFFMGLIVGVIPHIVSKVREGGQKLGAGEILLMVLPLPLLLLMANLRGESAADPAEVIAAINVPFMVFIFFAGILAAAALVVPGVSGSFLLLLLDIYPLVIFSLSSLRFLLADITNTELMADILKVLGPLALGIIVGGLSMLRLIEKLLEKHQRPVYSAILGLMAASLAVLIDPVFLAHSIVCRYAACLRCGAVPLVYRSGVSPLIVAAGIAAFSIGCVASYKLGKKRL